MKKSTKLHPLSNKNKETKITMTKKQKLCKIPTPEKQLKNIKSTKSITISSTFDDCLTKFGSKEIKANSIEKQDIENETNSDFSNSSNQPTLESKKFKNKGSKSDKKLIRKSDKVKNNVCKEPKEARLLVSEGIKQNKNKPKHKVILNKENEESDNEESCTSTSTLKRKSINSTGRKIKKLKQKTTLLEDNNSESLSDESIDGSEESLNSSISKKKVSMLQDRKQKKHKKKTPLTDNNDDNNSESLSDESIDGSEESLSTSRPISKKKVSTFQDGKQKKLKKKTPLADNNDDDSSLVSDESIDGSLYGDLDGSLTYGESSDEDLNNIDHILNSSLESGESGDDFPAKKKKMIIDCRMVPNLENQDISKERNLRIIATQGIVQLFGTINKHQLETREQLANSKTETEREKVLGSGRESFLGLFEKEKNSVKNRSYKTEVETSLKNEIKEEEENADPNQPQKKSTWNVFAQNFYKETPVPAWDKDSSDG